MCDRSQREFRRRAARFVASDGDSRTKNVVPTNPSLVADLTYCREAMRCRGNIRMGRYSGCVDRPIADRAPAWLQPIVEGAFAASLAGLRSCLREGAWRYFWDAVYRSETITRRLLLVSCSHPRDPVTPARRPWGSAA